MTLTTRAMEWLGQNRHRSYPMERDGWRKKVAPTSGLDCVLLDVLVFDSGASGDEVLSLEQVDVGASATVVTMKYGAQPIKIRLSGGTHDGDASFETAIGRVPGSGSVDAAFSMAFSSHAHILSKLGEGTWTLGCDVLPTRVVRLSDGHGADGLSASGSVGVDGHCESATASGDVVLEDGYRTSPIIHHGRVLVRVGKNYGFDPCKYNYGAEGSVDCRSPLFFFCGQNAINSGNITLGGGVGINVSQGRTYKVKSGTCKGKTVPCIEIVAGRELLDMYVPNGDEMV